MSHTPPDWALIEAAKRCDWIYLSDADDGGIAELRRDYRNADASPYNHCARAYRALCDNIAKHEQPPVDRKVLCAREATREADEADTCVEWSPEQIAIRAIELWEEGFGA